MKNKAKRIVSLVILFLMAYLSACGSGYLDWDYELPNGYRISRNNGNCIYLEGNEALYQNECRIGYQFVKEFAYDERYIFTRQIDEISTNNVFDEIYYIIDTDNNMIYGPYFNIQDLKKIALDSEIQIPTRWYSTIGDPNENDK